MFGDSSENPLAPFKCPLSTCRETLSSTMLLSHFMQTHQRDENAIDVKEVAEREKITLAVTEDYLKLDKIACLGILAYKNNIPNHSNVLLPCDLSNLEHSLPILIMACRKNYVKMFDATSDFIDPDADFIAVWLVMPDTETKMELHAIVTIHDEDIKKSRSSLVKVRSLSASQDVKEFMKYETNFVSVNSGFLKQITSATGIFMEVSIAENLL